MNEKARLVLGLLHTVIGRSKPSTKGNHAFHCPFCKHHKPKLEIDPTTGFYNCWTCQPATKGRNLVSLLKKLHADPTQVSEMRSYFPDGKGEEQNKTYQVPSYDKNGKLNYYISRSFEKDPGRKYNAPSCNKNELIGFEYYINWKVPVILCEGIFDAIALKRNAIPLFGKTIPKSLMMKLVENDVKTVYLALDNDALKEAINYSQQLLNLGKDVYLIELEGKDPSDIGFENITKYLHTAKQLTFSDLLLKKMQLCR